MASCLPDDTQPVEVQEPIASLDGKGIFKQNTLGRLNWENSKPFLQKLACFGKNGERASLQEMKETALVLSQEYCITGFQEGDPDTGQQSLIQVNSSIVLALDAEAIGRVFGMDFEGQPVWTFVDKEKGKEVTELMSTPNRPLRLENVLCADLREYLRQRKEVLYLHETDKRILNVSQVYFLKEEYFHGAQYNWAAHKVDNLKQGLRREWLSGAHTAFLANYIAAVAPLICRAFNHNCKGLKHGPGDVQVPEEKWNGDVQVPKGKRNGAAAMDGHERVQADPAESLRRVTRQSTLRSKRPPAEGPDDPSRRDSHDYQLDEDEGDGDATVDDGRVPTAGLVKKCKLKYHTVEVQQQGLPEEREHVSVELRNAREETKDTAVLAVKLLATQSNLMAIYDKDKAEFEQEKQEYLQERKEFEKEREMFLLEKMSHLRSKS